MLTKLYKDFFDYVSLHDVHKKGLIDQWYRENYLALACALRNTEGLKILINVESLVDFEVYCKKLFLFADIIVVRDIQKRDEKETELIEIPVSDKYRKTYHELNGKRIPPILVPPPQAGYWTSSKLKLNDGNEVPLAVKFNSYFPNKAYEWMLNNGKQYIETGQIVYAPFIPPIEVELEFLKQGVNLPSFYDLQPFFHKEYDWLNKKNLTSLLMLNLPTLENLDIDTLNRIKADNYDDFKAFRSDILDSIKQIKTNIGTEEFINEIKYIQRNKIDDSIDQLNKKLKRIESMRTLRALGGVIGLVGFNIAAYLGLSSVIPITGLATGLAGLVTEQIARLKEQHELEENPSYFLWRLQNT